MFPVQKIIANLNLWFNILTNIELGRHLSNLSRPRARYFFQPFHWFKWAPRVIWEKFILTLSGHSVLMET